jgi:hypothetical protein
MKLSSRLERDDHKHRINCGTFFTRFDDGQGNQRRLSRQYASPCPREEGLTQPPAASPGPSPMPITIIGNAGDRPKTSNGALGRAKPNPHRFKLLKPKLIRRIAAAASKTPTMSMPTSGLPRPGFNQKLSARTTADNTIRMPNAGRQPMKVPSTPLIRNAATPTPARAERAQGRGLLQALVVLGDQRNQRWHERRAGQAA